MTDEHRPAPRRSAGFSGWVMALIGLLAGIALAGAAGIFLLGIGWATPLEAQPVLSASPTPTESPTPTDDPATAAGDVSPECVRAAEYSIEVDEAVEELAQGAEAQDARAVQETLGRLQAAREISDGAAEDCLAQAGRSPESGQGPAVEESPESPSAGDSPTTEQSPTAEQSPTTEQSPTAEPTASETP